MLKDITTDIRKWSFTRLAVWIITLTVFGFIVGYGILELMGWNNKGASIYILMLFGSLLVPLFFIVMAGFKK